MGTAVSTGTSLPYDRPAVDLSLLAVRVVAGVIFAAHGAQKLFGAFGGPGLEKTVETMGPVAYPVVVGEFFGGLGLVVGFMTRLSAAAHIATVHAKHGFFLAGGGFEYNLAPTVIAGPWQNAIGRFAASTS